MAGNPNLVIRENFLTKNPCYTAQRSIVITGATLHSIGCPQPDPNVFVRNWNSASYNRACVHAFIGENEAIITLPCMTKTATSGVGKIHRAWHAGQNRKTKKSANNFAFGAEMTEPKWIKYTGGSSFAVAPENKAKAVAFVEKVTQNAVEVYARLFNYHNLEVNKNTLFSHYEGSQSPLLCASGHGDPDHLWRGLGMNYNMDKFRADVKERLRELREESEVPEFLKDSVLFEQYMNEWLNKVQHLPISAWAQGDIEWAVSNGIMAGDTDGNLMPKGFPTREQLMVMLHRYHENKDRIQ